MRQIKPLVLSFGLFVLVASPGIAFEDAPAPPEGKALIYIYRLPAMALAVRSAEFYVNGKEAFDLGNHDYSFFYASPGQYNLTQKWSWMFDMPWGGFRPIEQDITVAAGEIRYFRLTAGASSSYVDRGSEISFAWQFTEVPAEQALSEIAQEKFQKQNEKVGFSF